MSGPKCYDYWVDTETEEQIRERIRRQKEAEELRVAREKYSKALDGLQNIINQVSADIRRIDEIGAVSRKKITCHLEAKKLLDEMREYVRNGRTLQLNSINDINKQISHVMKNCSQLENEKREMEKIILKFTDEVSGEMDDMVSEVNIVFTFLEKKEEENPYPELINEEMKKVENVVFSKRLRVKYESIHNMLESVSSISEYKSLYSLMTLPFVKECIEYNDLFNEFLLKYEVLCKELKINMLSFDKNVDPVEELKKEIDRLEEEILEKKKQEYITECLEETMEEMGYEFVGERSVVKKSGKRFQNKLYKFEDDTVVNVTIQDNGQISMELGGVDTVDRTATSEETVILVSDMEKFCAVNEEIQKNLKKKGIKGNNILHMPPTAENAQIINVEKYQLHGKVEKIKTGKRNASKVQSGVKLYQED